MNPNSPKNPLQSTDMQGSSELENCRWELFAQAIANGKTAKEAYCEVYKCKGENNTARVGGAKLLAKALVRARVDWLQKQNSRVAALGREETLRILADIARNSEIDTRARIQAIQENNRMNGWAESSFNLKSEGIVFNLGKVLGGENGG